MSIDITFYFCYNKDKKGGFDMVLIKNTPKYHYWIPEEDNVFRISKVLFEFSDNMKKEYDIISSPLHYDYGHYFVRETE